MQTPTSTLVYSGDTEPAESVRDLCHGDVDVLIHECSFPDAYASVSNHTTPAKLRDLIYDQHIDRIVLHERSGGLANADLILSLFVLTLKDGLFGRGLGYNNCAAMDALELALIGEGFQIAAGSSLTNIKCGANIRYTDALLTLQQLPDLELTVSA